MKRDLVLLAILLSVIGTLIGVFVSKMDALQAQQIDPIDCRPLSINLYANGKLEIICRMPEQPGASNETGAAKN